MRQSQFALSLFLLLALPALSSAATCGNLTANYTMDGNLFVQGTCFNITNHNITLNCAGYNITGAGTGGYAAVFDSSYQNVSVKNCVIKNFTIPVLFTNGATNGSLFNLTLLNYSQAGVFFNNSNNASVYFVYANSSSTAYAIWLNASNYSTIANSTVNATGSNMYGIYLSYSSFSSIINSTGNSSSGIGIILSGSSNNNIINSTGIATSSYGIYLSSSSNNNIINSTGIGTGSSSYGIYLDTSSNNNITNSTFIATTDGWGTRLQSGSNNIITNCTGISNSGNGISVASNNIILNSTGISNSGYGIHLAGNYNNLTNSTGISTSSHGIYIQNSNSIILNSTGISTSGGGIYLNSNNIITNSTFISSSGPGANFSDASNLFINSSIHSTSGFDIYSFGDAGKNIILNTTFNRSNMGWGTGVNNITVQWYVDVNVTNLTGLAEAGAIVSAIPATGGNAVFNATTGSNGYIATQALAEFFANGSFIYNGTSDANVTFYNNYTFYADKIGYLVNYTNASINQSGSTITLTIRPGTSACGTITQNTTLDMRINSSGTCITIGNNNITLDCAGLSITGDGTGFGIWNNGYDNVTIRSCTILNFTNGIVFTNSALNGTIYNGSVYNVSDTAILINASSNFTTVYNMSQIWSRGTGLSINGTYNFTGYQFAAFSSQAYKAAVSIDAASFNALLYNFSANGSILYANGLRVSGGGHTLYNFTARATSAGSTDGASIYVLNGGNITLYRFVAASSGGSSQIYIDSTASNITAYNFSMPEGCAGSPGGVTLLGRFSTLYNFTLRLCYNKFDLAGSNNSVYNFTLISTFYSGGGSYGALTVDGYNSSISNFTIISTPLTDGDALHATGMNPALEVEGGYGRTAVMSNFTISTNSTGLYVTANPFNHTISNFTIWLNGSAPQSAGILLGGTGSYSSVNATLSNFTIIATRYSTGIKILGKNSTLYNFTVTSNLSAAISIGNNTAQGPNSTAFNTTLYNFTAISLSGYGMFISTNTTHYLNNATNTKAISGIIQGGNDSTDYGLFITGGAKNNQFIDCIINSTAGLSGFNTTYFAGNTTNNTFLNATFNRSLIGWDAGPFGSGLATDPAINVQWYVDVYVNYSNGSAASGASVNITNASVPGTAMFSGVTDANGYLGRFNLTELFANGSFIYNSTNQTNVTFFTPHNITANKSGYITNSTPFYINGSTTITIVLSPQDSVAPNVSFVSPFAGTNVSSSLLVNLSANDSGYGVSFVQVRFENATTNATPWLNTSLGSGTIYAGFWNITSAAASIADGTYNITVNATDFSGNSNKTVNVSVTFDTIAPVLNVSSPLNGSTVGATWDILVQANDSTTGVMNVSFRIERNGANLTSWQNMTMVSGDIYSGYWRYSYDSSALADGAYNITFNATDFDPENASVYVAVTKSTGGGGEEEHHNPPPPEAPPAPPPAPIPCEPPYCTVSAPQPPNVSLPLQPNVTPVKPPEEKPPEKPPEEKPPTIVPKEVDQALQRVKVELDTAVLQLEMMLKGKNYGEASAKLQEVRAAINAGDYELAQQLLGDVRTLMEQAQGKGDMTPWIVAGVLFAVLLGGTLYYFLRLRRR